MTDVRSIFKDMIKQRRVQAVTGVTAVAAAILWLAGVPFCEYVAAAAVVVCAVATVHWIDDEEKLEEEQLQQAVVKK